MREAGKVKHIFSKSIYQDLFDSLEKANNILKTLVDQSVEYQKSYRTRESEELLSRHRISRRVAGSVHMALTRDKYWVCPCRDKHHIRFILNPSFDGFDFDVNESEDFGAFGVILTTPVSDAYGGTSFN